MRCGCKWSSLLRDHATILAEIDRWETSRKVSFLSCVVGHIVVVEPKRILPE
jgi:hypothetical protein